MSLNESLLKYKYKEMKLEDLIMILRIEEDNCISENKIRNHSIESKANVMEQMYNTKTKKRKHSEKGSNQGPNVGDSKWFKGATCVINQGIVQRIVTNVMIKGTRKSFKPT